MTEEEFFAVLAEIKRSWQMHWSSGRIRGWDWTNSQSYCPITAVYKECKNEYLDTIYASEAGHRLGMSEDLKRKVIASADDFKSSDNIPEMRQKLKKTLGLYA